MIEQNKIIALINFNPQINETYYTNDIITNVLCYTDQKDKKILNTNS